MRIALDGTFRVVGIVVKGNAAARMRMGHRATPSRMGVAWQHRLQPWRNPYLRWRIETWSGLHADAITRETFLRFVWQHRAELRRYLRWAAAEGGK